MKPVYEVVSGSILLSKGKTSFACIAIVSFR
jgi:hypothetical protein